MCWLEVRYELTRLVRLPAYAVPTLVFPLMFYLLFGVAMIYSATMRAGGTVWPPLVVV